jgi:hypothetical protein
MRPKGEIFWYAIKFALTLIGMLLALAYCNRKPEPTLREANPQLFNKAQWQSTFRMEMRGERGL